MRRFVFGVAVVGPLLVALVFVVSSRGNASPPSDDESRVQQGLDISPVPVHLQGNNRALVGMGSYLINAVGSCADCHSCPTYTPGHNPYDGVGDGTFNPDNYLAGGVPFGPPGGLVSANITPDLDTGMPEGHTFEQFKQTLRTGHDPDNPNHILQVMPWPVIRHMTDRDLLAIYTYLSAIDHKEPGSCQNPGQ